MRTALFGAFGALVFALSSAAQSPSCGLHIGSTGGAVKMPDGNFIVLDTFQDTDRLMHVDARTGLRTVLSLTSPPANALDLSNDIVLESPSDLLISADASTRLLRVDLQDHNSASWLVTDIMSSAILSSLAVGPDGTIFAAAPNLGFIYAVNPDSGAAAVIASATVGSGPALLFPTQMTVSDTGVLFVADYLLRAIVAVDTATGVRQVLSSDQVGGGPGFGLVSDLKIRDNGDLLAYSLDLAAIVAIDTATGERSIVSAPAILEQHLIGVRQIIDDSDGVIEALLGSNASSANGVSIVSIDIASGAATYITRSSFIVDTAVDTGGQAYATAPGLGAIFRLDDDYRVESLVADDNLGDGPSLHYAVRLAVDENGQLFFASSFEQSIVQVDPATGDRFVVSGVDVGAGPEFARLDALTPASGRRLFVSDRVLGAVIAVDTATGDRQIVSAASIGQGPPLDNIGGLAMEDSDHLIAVALGPNATVLRITIATGNRETVSGGAVGSGPPLVLPSDIVVTPDGAAYVKGDGLWSVNLTSGERVRLYEEDAPPGISLPFPQISALADGRILGSGNAEVLAIYSPTGEARQIVGDVDSDGFADYCDNCVSVADFTQFDADEDGFGNRCDADLNNDCVVNALDLGLLKSDFFSTSDVSDINVDGVVNTLDLGLMRDAFFRPPGPSAQAECP